MPSSSNGKHHYAAASDEEEQLALALAISASLAESSSAPSSSSAGPSAGTSASKSSQRPSKASEPSTHSHAKPGRSTSAQLNQQRAPAAVPSSQSASHLPSSSTNTPASKPHSKSSRPSSSRPASSSQQAAARPSSSKPAAGPRHFHSDPSKCAGCGKSVWTQRLNALDRIWHPECFVCGYCSQPLHTGSGGQFALGNEDHWPYHMECYRLKFHPICTVCKTFVPAQPDGRVEYKEQGFWREPYCTIHARDGTPTCCSCSRFQPKGEEFVQLTDSRHVCLICLGTLVMDTRDAQPLYEEVLKFFKHMGMPHPVKAPFMLVDAHTLNDYSVREGKDHSGGPIFHIRGLTLATVYQRIPTIVRAQGGSGFDVSSVATAIPQTQGSITCQVSAILVLYGLPRLLTGCIMAHELMHAWLRMKHVAGLDAKVEEGLCQLMAYVWLDNQANSLTEPDLQRLASYFAYQIREDTSDVYGEGFRDAYEAFTQRGLTAVVNDVLRRGTFM